MVSMALESKRNPFLLTGLDGSHVRHQQPTSQVTGWKPNRRLSDEGGGKDDQSMKSGRVTGHVSETRRWRPHSVKNV